ncbi:MAG TPA: amino acid-binding protein [Spirochaetota bacterium]|nr:amino acid-binding protein [Spirochaetota bacterium]HPJ37069.1 amino acid-binding protein [Spirochaetota bacterium]HPQ52555.1 amino acid-binding protein [Spirochaetota bacterium]
MNVKQLSIFLENKPGHLQSALKVLAEKNINIKTLTIAEVTDFGIVRMIVNSPDEAQRALKEQHFTCSTTEVLGLEIDDKPGELLRALETFAKNNLNIEYMYAFTEKRDDKAVMIFRFDDIEEAKKVLIAQGFNIVKNIEIIGE